MTAEATRTAALSASTGSLPQPVAASTRRSRVALVLGGACALVVGYTATGVNIAFPAIEAQFRGTSRSTLSWGIAGYLIVLAALLLPGGRMADLRGRRRLFLGGLAVFGVGSLALVLAPSAWVFLAARIVQAAGAALVLPGATALVLAEYPDDRRIWVAGMLTSLGSLGQAFAPTVAALLVDAAGWRLVFLPAVLASAAGVVFGARVFRETARQETGGPVDRVGFPLGSAAVALLLFAVIEGPRWGWTSPAVLGALVGAAVLFPAFVVRSNRHPRPLVDPRVVAKRAVWSASVGYLFVAALGQTMWFVLPLFLKGLRGYSLLRVGVAMTPLAITSALVGWLGTRVVQRTGRPRSMAIVGAASMAAGMAWFVAFATSDAPYPAALLPGLIAVGAGIGGSQAPLAGLTLRDVDRSDFGQVNGVFQTVRFVASGFGTAVVVALLGNAVDIPTAAFRRVFAVQFAASVACLLFEAVALPGRRTGRRRPG